MAIELLDIVDIPTQCIIGYHTQEFRESEQSLNFPVLCSDSKAWLGNAYYFWLNLDFAKYWGMDMKRLTSKYDVYIAHIQLDNFLNTTFNEVHYELWIDSVEEVIKMLDKENKNITLKAAHRFLMDKFWKPLGINGIIYDDLPHNNYNKKRTHSLLDPLYYKKRIQVAVFNTELIHNFELELERQNCVV